MKKQILAGALSAMILLTGCTNTKTISCYSSDMMDGVDTTTLTALNLSDIKGTDQNQKEELTQFSLELFTKLLKEGENTMISPLSIVSALSMTANGAGGDTLTQMEEMLHGDIGTMNAYLKAYTDVLPSEDAYKVNIANSIWLRDSDGLSVNPDFLAINKDFYDASIYKAPFDESTRKDINAWVDEKTDGMIDSVLEKPITVDVMMYLINAILFDGVWEDPYETHQVRDGIFTTQDGTQQNITMMSSEEYAYLESDTATGMMRYYEDGKYAFVAILPQENTSMGTFLETLDGESLIALMENHQNTAVNVKLPKFTTEYDVKLKDTLKALGMVDAFDSKVSDFSDMATSTRGNIFVSSVIHKTKIAVNEQGTKAGAVTVVTMSGEGAMAEPPKIVSLDRPFFYMIVDTEEYLPLFMGVMMDMG